MRKLAVYIDGFNLYHAIKELGKPAYKWLNLYKLAEQLAGQNETIEKVVYFSAYATWLPDSYYRHRQYVKALENAGVEVVMAHFKQKQMTCRNCEVEWISREEKETDVHLALRLLGDAEDCVYDRGMLVTADSDLVPAVRMVKSRHSDKRIVVAAPPRRYAAGRHLRQVADSYFQIGTKKIETSLFPEKIYNSMGNQIATRPVSYKP